MSECEGDQEQDAEAAWAEVSEGGYILGRLQGTQLLSYNFRWPAGYDAHSSSACACLSHCGLR